MEEAKPYKVIKVKMGLDNDKELVNIIRSITDVPICVDANQGWKTKEQGLEMVEWLSDKNCLFIEQPFSKEMLEETKMVARAQQLANYCRRGFSTVARHKQAERILRRHKH